MPANAPYILDEPEVALSPQRQLAFPDEPARCGPAVAGWGAIRPIALEDTDHYRITRSMITNRTGLLVDLFEDIG